MNCTREQILDYLSQTLIKTPYLLCDDGYIEKLLLKIIVKVINFKKIFTIMHPVAF